MPHKLLLSSWMEKVGIICVQIYAGVDGGCLINSFEPGMEMFGTHTKMGCQGQSRLANGVHGNQQWSMVAISGKQ